MTTPAPITDNPIALLAQPAVDLLRNPLNPLAYLPGTWMLLAGLDHLFGNTRTVAAQPGAAAAPLSKVEAPTALADAVATPKAKRTRGEGAKTLEKRRKLEVASVAAASPAVAEVPAPAQDSTNGAESASQIAAAPEVAMVAGEREDTLSVTHVPFQDFAVPAGAVAEEVQSNPAAPEPFESIAIVRALSFIDSVQPGDRK